MTDLNLKDIVPWVGAALAAPVAYVWKRATGAVQKDELSKVVTDLKDVMKQHAEEDTRRFTGIFSRLDEVAKATSRIEGYIQGTKER